MSILTAALLIGTALAQTPDFQSQTHEVLLEVVVRDAHGKLVTKLDPSQVSVYEDGVRQDLKSFRLVPGKEVRAELERETALATTKPGAVHFDAAGRPPTNPLRTINVVCLILNDISSSTRAFAFDAAKKFVNNELRPDTFIGVFTLDGTGLRPVFPFSNNRERLLKAVELAATNQLPAMSESSAAMLNGLSMSTIGVMPGSSANIATAGPAGVSIAAAPGAGVPASVDIGSARGDMEDKIIRALRELDALIGLMKQLNQLPFQKTVLLMSSGLTRPPDQMEYWQSLIKLANSGGVTFYGLDVHGLDPDYDPLDEAKTRLQSVASISQGQSTAGMPQRSPTAPGGSSTTGTSSAQQMMTSMHQTDYLKYAVQSANSQEALRELSESTGGFVIANTNNTEALLAKVMEDVDTHYELAYRPATLSSDGHFRKIEVKLSRPGLRIETRTGYFAVPETGEGPLTPGDFGALQALDAKPQPADFQFNTQAFRFRKSQFAIAFEVPIANLTATPEAGKHRYHAYLLALVKNPQGEIVERISKDVPSEVADSLRPALRSEAVTYEHAVNLPPGRYTVETAVVDQEGNRASTNTFEIETRDQPGPVVSDIALLRRVHPLDRDPDPSDSFETTGKRAQPFVTTTLPAGSLPYIYFVAYPSGNEPATLQAQFLKDGRVLTTQKSPLPQPDSTGAVPMTLQPTAFPGNYEVKITVEQGQLSSQRSLKYTIANK